MIYWSPYLDGMYGVWRSVNGSASLDADETASREHHPPRLEQGINFYDTAIAYQNGSSERYAGRRCGRWQQTRGGGAGHRFCHELLPRLPRDQRKQAIARSA
ncbi:hypothetical protein LNQ03_22785 [Klebsiella pneumoniae subsp. pneumoniae]|nr:hypothetical protein [Klebsiella pneumoniae subsp. pneumoniae]